VNYQLGLYGPKERSGVDVEARVSVDACSNR
jgi:hypothetical protein